MYATYKLLTYITKSAIIKPMMNKSTEQTPNQIQIEVYRDGNIDREYQVRQAATNIGSSLLEAAQDATDYVSYVAGNFVKLGRLGIHDAVYRTDYVSEWFEEMEQAREEAFRDKVGL